MQKLEALQLKQQKQGNESSTTNQLSLVFAVVVQGTRLMMTQFSQLPLKLLKMTKTLLGVGVFISLAPLIIDHTVSHADCNFKRITFAGVSTSRQKHDNKGCCVQPLRKTNFFCGLAKITQTQYYVLCFGCTEEVIYTNNMFITESKLVLCH